MPAVTHALRKTMHTYKRSNAAYLKHYQYRRSHYAHRQSNIPGLVLVETRCCALPCSVRASVNRTTAAESERKSLVPERQVLRDGLVVALPKSDDLRVSDYFRHHEAVHKTLFSEALRSALAAPIPLLEQIAARVLQRSMSCPSGSKVCIHQYTYPLAMSRPIRSLGLRKNMYEL